MRKTLAAFSAVAIGLALGQGTAHAAPPPKPAGPNPLLALMASGTSVDYQAWQVYLQSQAAERAHERLAALRAQKSPLLRVADASSVLVQEQLPDGTSGPGNAQKVPTFGTGDGKAAKITLQGYLEGTNDRDFYAIRLNAGDVLGTSGTGSAKALDIYDSKQQLVEGSTSDHSGSYPASSPLPGGGNVATDYVAARDGLYYIGVGAGVGTYNVTVEGYRPPLEGARPTQTIFLDFDGAFADSGSLGSGRVTLSPMSKYLAGWGLTEADEPKLIDAIVAAVTENLKQDMVKKGLNNRFKLKITNSKDDPDTFGKANVSRVVIGGDNVEFGAQTPLPILGASTDIDPGNFSTAETSFVLMDRISGPAGPDDSFNTYMTSRSNKIAFIGQALGNVAAHEVGHQMGDWHTDNLDDKANLMDAGGAGYATLFGVGRDGIGGTADDIDVDFGEDTYRPNEGFTGTEDTLNRFDFGVTS